MVEGLRNSGIEITGSVPWGAHFCQFYESGDDLLDILVPYFRAGLENNEFCMWVTAEPIGVAEAKQALIRAVPHSDRYLESGQLEIIPYGEWYLLGGSFDSDRVLSGWVDKLTKALAKGFDGLRLTGNTFWLEKKDWRGFADYERAVDNVIGQYRMVALCTYPVSRCGLSEIADVISNHQFALIKRHGQWDMIESAERKRAEVALRESEARYRLLFQNMPDAFAYHKMDLDEEGHPIDYTFLEVNEAFERQTGLKRESIVGRKVKEVLPGIEKSDFDWIRTYSRVAATGEVMRFEQYSEPLNQWYSVVAYSPANGHFVTVFSDITERKLAQAERGRAQLELERRAAELHAANKELESFSYSVSHDLRAPLRGIDGLSMALLEDYTDKLDERGKRYLQLVRQESQRMGLLIDDMLRLSRITRQEMRREQVDLSRLSEEVATELRTRQPERQVELVVAPGLKVNGDGRLLRVALENLLGNAWKFTSKHQSARIEVGAMERDGETVYFVRDDGSGFDMAFADKLFGAFQRLHGEKDFPGSGIGLATVQRIVHRHGGRVWAQGAVEQGATFYFTL